MNIDKLIEFRKFAFKYRRPEQFQEFVFSCVTHGYSKWLSREWADFLDKFGSWGIKVNFDENYKRKQLERKFKDQFNNYWQVERKSRIDNNRSVEYSDKYYDSLFVSSNVRAQLNSWIHDINNPIYFPDYSVTSLPWFKDYLKYLKRQSF